jgi:uncharacterized protein YbaR (Trm112 family)
VIMTVRCAVVMGLERGIPNMLDRSARDLANEGLLRQS